MSVLRISLHAPGFGQQCYKRHHCSLLISHRGGQKGVHHLLKIIITRTVLTKVNFCNLYASFTFSRALPLVSGLGETQKPNNEIISSIAHALSRIFSVLSSRTLCFMLPSLCDVITAYPWSHFHSPITGLSLGGHFTDFSLLPLMGSLFT